MSGRPDPVDFSGDDLRVLANESMTKNVFGNFGWNHYTIIIQFARKNKVPMRNRNANANANANAGRVTTGGSAGGGYDQFGMQQWTLGMAEAYPLPGSNQNWVCPALEFKQVKARAILLRRFLQPIF